MLLSANNSLNISCLFFKKKVLMVDFMSCESYCQKNCSMLILICSSFQNALCCTSADLSSYSAKL